MIYLAAILVVVFWASMVSTKKARRLLLYVSHLVGIIVTMAAMSLSFIWAILVLTSIGN